MVLALPNHIKDLLKTILLRSRLKIKPYHTALQQGTKSKVRGAKKPGVQARERGRFARVAGARRGATVARDAPPNSVTYSKTCADACHNIARTTKSNE